MRWCGFYELTSNTPTYFGCTCNLDVDVGTAVGMKTQSGGEDAQLLWGKTEDDPACLLPEVSGQEGNKLGVSEESVR